MMMDDGVDVGPCAVDLGVDETLGVERRRRVAATVDDRSIEIHDDEIVGRHELGRESR